MTTRICSISFILLSVLLIGNACRQSRKVQQVTIAIKEVSKVPITLSIGRTFLGNARFNFIDTPNSRLTYSFIPGDILSINKDTSIYLFQNDTLLIDNSSGVPVLYSSNSENRLYNNLFYETSSSFFYQRELALNYFFDKSDSILANSTFIDNHLEKNKTAKAQKMTELFTKYSFSQKTKSELLDYILETEQLSLSFFYFRAYINQYDSLGVLEKNLNYYIREINKQKISIFSQNTIFSMIESIANLLIKKSIKTINNSDDFIDYYKLIKKHFAKGTTFYDYLIACLSVQMSKRDIKSKSAIFTLFKKDAKRSKFKSYAKQKSVLATGQLNDFNLDENLYDVHHNSTNISNLIERFKGKPLLIDFWASWCLPCLIKIPDVIAYPQKYQGLNIVFISLDRSHDLWKLYLYEKDLLSYAQYRRNYNNQSVIFEQFRDIPKYGLLSKDGKIELIDEVNDSIITRYYEKFKN